MDEAVVRRAASEVLDALRTQVWPLPILGVTLSVVLGVGLPRLDGAVDGRLPASATVYLFGGGADAARTLLSAIAGSLITVTSLTFSLTVVTLQLASSQFSPRLLRTFSRDRFVHVTLMLFLSTFIYALTVLRTVRTANDRQAVFVPQLSVTLAFLLTIGSVVGLVLFLAHLAQEIRVETMLRDVHRDASAAIRRLLPGRDDDDDHRQPAADPLPSVPPPNAVPLLAPTSGFLVRVDERAMLAAACEAGVVMLLDRSPGSSLVAGTPIGHAWRTDAGQLDQEARERLHRRLADAVTTSHERTEAQDVAYGLRQITDVATKALSPGVNDPTTAVHALGHSSALLGELVDRYLGPRVLREKTGPGRRGDSPQAGLGGGGAVRVVLHRPDLDELLELAVGQPRRYGAGDPAVLARLYVLLLELTWRVHQPAQREMIADQLARLRDTTGRQDFDAAERGQLCELGRQVDRALDRRTTP